MDTVKHCQHCGKPLTAKAIHGLCPECFMKVGLGSAQGPESGKPEGTRRVVPLTVEEVGKLFPQLEVLELLGQGGMGAVYKARQPQLDRLVALKILTVQAGLDPGFAERFTREARALAKLNHPNIVAMYEFGNVGGLHYFIMEYLDGLNLRQLEQSGKLSAREALRIISQICEALQFAHDEGVVHRDIKPENVLLDKKGKAKIADFGLAKILGREPEALRLTGARDFMGTPHYMAPEQVEHPQTVDHRADIYSLGVVFYEMLTGELPLGKFQPPSRKVQVDVRLDEVVLHALEKEPERRYQHASEVKTDVETIATSARTATPPPLVAPAKPNGWQPAILLVAGLISTALLVIATVLPRPANWIALLFGSFGVVVAGVKLAGLWPFPSPLFPDSIFTGRNLPSARTLEPKGAGPNSPSPVRAAVAVGLAMFVVIFLAALGVAVFLPKAQVERNLGIGLLLGIVNGLMAGVLVYVGFWGAKARAAARGGSNSPRPKQGSRSGINTSSLFGLSLFTLLVAVFAGYLWLFPPARLLRNESGAHPHAGHLKSADAPGSATALPGPAEKATASSTRLGQPLASPIIWLGEAGIDLEAADPRTAPCTQIEIDDLQPDGTSRFRSVTRQVIAGEEPLRQLQFKNSDFVDLQRMLDAEGNTIPFVSMHNSEHFHYTATLARPVPPGSGFVFGCEGIVRNKLDEDPVQGEFTYRFTHFPNTGRPTRRVEIHRLPAGAELLEVSTPGIQRWRAGRSEIVIDQLVPAGGSISLSYRYRLKTPESNR